jgi:hypothetical protein
MSELPESPMTEEEQVATATQVGIEAIRRIHLIEREMLSRAIQALVGATKKSAVEVVTILSEGLDEGYTEAMKSAYASAEIVTTTEAGVPQFGEKKISTPKLILP